MILQSALAALIVTLACLALLLSGAGRRLLLDRPNARSLHRSPVPRSGGLAIAAGVAAGFVLGASSAPQAITLTLAAAGALAAVSFADDLLALPTLARLLAHLAAAVLVVALALDVSSPIAFVLVALALAWSANLYNFMDGSDGLAGGMAVIGFGAYALAALQAGHLAMAELCAVLAVAAGTFLLFNFPPARIFMGDSGSVPLGFLAGALGVLGWRGGSWPLWFPMLVFAPFACDATLTLLKRVARRQPVWRAHREHYYQRLVRMGFGHRGTAWIEWAAMAACAGIALAARQAPSALQAGALAAATLVLVLVAFWIDARWARWLRASGDSGDAPA